MKHPDDEHLLAWLDGESGALEGGDDVAAHVEQCARCQQWLDAASSLGAAVRVWAEDAAPPPVADLADRVLRAAGARVEPRAVGSGGPPAATRPAVPVRAARARWLRVGVPVATVFAAAAAVLVALRGFHVLGRGPIEHAVIAEMAEHGSEVLSVESDGTGHNDVSVMEMRDEHQRSTTAVVWIADDEPKPSSDDRVAPQE